MATFIMHNKGESKVACRTSPYVAIEFVSTIHNTFLKSVGILPLRDF